MIVKTGQNISRCLKILLTPIKQEESEVERKNCISFKTCENGFDYK